MRFVDLFAGIGGFHRALARLGHECVFVSEIDEELRRLYALNFPTARELVHGDIRECRELVPPHDILCAGFPCQPFSKSGFQQGTKDITEGTLFHEVYRILRHRLPEYVILENVGNFEQHDGGRTWRIVKKSLQRLGYNVKGTEHVKSGGPGLLSPHHLGFPHARERFFIVARLGDLPEHPFPPVNRHAETDLWSMVQLPTELTERDWCETALTDAQVNCVLHWNAFLSKLPEDVKLPSFPIWGDEIDATYPYDEHTPASSPLSVLVECLHPQLDGRNPTKDDLLDLLPAYARRGEKSDPSRFPEWKRRFIRQNREWFREIRGWIPDGWVERLRQFPPSLRKLEWNCQGEERDLWKLVLQFRPSGLRAKRFTSVPALVAMTTTQIPILGPERRFLTRVEGLRLQGFSDTHHTPRSYGRTFQALGNAVHVDVVEAIASRLLTAPAAQETVPESEQAALAVAQ